MDKGGSPLKLHTKLKFWYQHFIKGEGNFQDSLHPVAVISTVEQFWAYYQHFKRPSQLPQGSYIYLFKEQVKPVWEDQHNEKGGAFLLKFEKVKCDRLWQNLLLSFAVSDPKETGDINGIRIKIRKDQHAQVDYWVNNTDSENIDGYREWILNSAELNAETPLEFIQFFDRQA